MEETQDTDNQITNSKPWLWKKGQSGNPAGRPKGKTMKEYAKELLACQSEEERQEFLHGLPKEIIWAMAEGRPSQGIEHSGEITEKQYIITRGEDKLHNLPEGSPEVPITDKTD